MPEVLESSHYELHEAGDLNRLKGYLMPGEEDRYNVSLLVGDLLWLLILNGGHSKDEIMRFLERYIDLIEPQFKKMYNA